ncbi:MAG: OmpW family outer membrane protein [Pseudomonadota bacterium]
MNKRVLAVSAAVFSCLGAGWAGVAVAAGDPAWLVRGRAIVVAPDDSSSPAGLAVHNDAVAEIDITRFFTRNIAAELILAASSHEVHLGGTSLGSTKVLPPTLTLQYHFLPDGLIRPYVGAGLNYAHFYNGSGTLDNLKLTDSFGWAAQAGVDYMLTDRASLNFDVKYINIETEVKSAGTKVFDLKINPWVIGVGVGYRF